MATEATRVKIDQAVIEALQGLYGTVREVGPAQDLQQDLGLDSIEMVELASSVAKQLGAGSRRLDLAGVVTVRDLTARLEEALGSEGT